ncbi:Protein AF-9 [Wickerhamiella sorbophila]|uniref:Protein AF-9 homolog n=1 Tax=Wickerhamiella sorbophila TaxID=45607 RepID=A0A2T0FKC8_9ASCO|nr:Protein AF-9 [Wickerhamiella sorbophila]PRT55438.1 Protein AF-9 [Wickerhamiella sorbophila]
MPVKRVKSVSVTRPIMYGNVAVPLEAVDRKKDTPEDHTHKWTVFVRDPAGKDDLGYFIKKVSFKLHDTYANSLRTIEKPPFEVTETGWGEFEITIRIVFAQAAAEKTIVLYHHLKLHPFGPGVVPGETPKPQPVESILYDELVFCEPTEAMFQILTSRPGAVIPTKPDPPLKPFSYQTETEEIDRLDAANEQVLEQLKKLKEQIQELEKEKAQLQA